MTAAVDSPGPSRPVADWARLGMLAGAAWFLLLSLLYAEALPPLFRAMQGASARLDAAFFTSVASVLARTCVVVFMAIQAWLIMARPAPVARTPGIVAVLTALAGTYGVWLVGFLPSSALPLPMAVLAAALSLVGSALAAFNILHLGRSFSIAPQARVLVTRGPYAFLRHPLYAAEELALIGVAMHVVWYAAIPFVAFHIALQTRRMAYEERLLRQVFPQYDAYARRTARWIPGIW